MTTTAELIPGLAKNRAVVPSFNLKTALEYEIEHRCRCKVTKRLALKLAHAVISDTKDGVFLAEKLAEKLRARLKHEAALKEIYLERHRSDL